MVRRKGCPAVLPRTPVASPERPTAIANRVTASSRDGAPGTSRVSSSSSRRRRASKASSDIGSVSRAVIEPPPRGRPAGAPSRREASTGRSRAARPRARPSRQRSTRHGGGARSRRADQATGERGPRAAPARRRDPRSDDPAPRSSRAPGAARGCDRARCAGGSPSDPRHERRCDRARVEDFPHREGFPAVATRPPTLPGRRPRHRRRHDRRAKPVAAVGRSARSRTRQTPPRSRTTYRPGPVPTCRRVSAWRSASPADHPPTIESRSQAPRQTRALARAKRVSCRSASVTIAISGSPGSWTAASCTLHPRWPRPGWPRPAIMSPRTRGWAVSGLLRGT